MKCSIKKNQPVWNDSISTTSKTSFRRLNTHVDHDVCVVGAGIAGIINAYLLAKSGKTVVLLESGDVANAATRDTTAHLTWVLDKRYHDLWSVFGDDETKLIAESHRNAIDSIEKIISDEKIECNFQRVSGYLFAPQPIKDEKENATYWDSELYALRSLGFTGIHSLSKAPIKSFNTGPAIEFPKQAQFNPIRFVEGLLKAFQNLGGVVYEHTRVVNVTGETPVIVETDAGGIVTAESVIIATNSPINNLFTMHTKQAPYQSYAVALSVPRYSHEHALYWDNLDPYHYVRFVSTADKDLIIVGGEDHKTGQEDDWVERFEHLEAWARERFPQCGGVEYEWSGQVLEPVDGIGFIGRNPGNKNVYIATGFSGNGMTYAMISGQLLCDLIHNKENVFEKIYDPSRITVQAATEFAKENLNVAWQMSDWVKSSEVQSADEIPKDEGAIIRKGFKMLAVYKDEEGSLFSYSAKCPHLGCIVHWNSSAKTWDCPCHGSRFSCHGEVINGPATKDLKEEHEIENKISQKKLEVVIP